MPFYHGKILELLALEEHRDQFYLRLKLTFGEEIEFVWKIDWKTAESLIKATEINEKVKYRLSFQHSFDSTKNEYHSYLTRTYIDQSDRIQFFCSDEYVRELQAIKKLENIHDLSTLSFLSRNLEIKDDRALQGEAKKNEIEHVEKQNKKPKLSGVSLSLLTISTICAIIFTFFTFSSNPNTDQSQGAIAQANDKNEELLDKIEQEEVNYLPAAVKKVIVASEPMANPLVLELDEAVTYGVPEGMVALTFDDGPSFYSLEISNLLKKYEVGGTFFFIGKNVVKHPEYVEYVHKNGFSIGSHSMNHVDVSNLSYEGQKREIIDSFKLIEEITHKKVDLFRPPFGAKNNHTIDLMDELNSKMVLWDRDPEDWRVRNAEVILQYIKDSDPSGSIILLHESQAVMDALPMIIEYLQEQGLQIVSLQ